MVGSAGSVRVVIIVYIVLLYFGNPRLYRNLFKYHPFKIDTFNTEFQEFLELEFPIPPQELLISGTPGTPGTPQAGLELPGTRRELLELQLLSGNSRNSLSTVSSCRQQFGPRTSGFNTEPLGLLKITKVYY
jgi:hypothetical protein